jgi:hypothetical protein
MTSSPVVSSAESVTSQLLSGILTVPSGFNVTAVNPLVPADAAPYGAVTASVTSAGGAAYDVEFSPVVIPCGYAMCTSTTSSLAVGDAAPYEAQTTFAPDVGAEAQCGYNGDTLEVGCDAIVGNECISVRTSRPGVSTADAVAVLRAAVEYAVKSGA